MRNKKQESKAVILVFALTLLVSVALQDWSQFFLSAAALMTAIRAHELEFA